MSSKNTRPSSSPSRNSFLYARRRRIKFCWPGSNSTKAFEYNRSECASSQPKPNRNLYCKLGSLHTMKSTNSLTPASRAPAPLSLGMIISVNNSTVRYSAVVKNFGEYAAFLICGESARTCPQAKLQRLNPENCAATDASESIRSTSRRSTPCPAIMPSRYFRHRRPRASRQVSNRPFNQSLGGFMRVTRPTVFHRTVAVVPARLQNSNRLFQVDRKFLAFFVGVDVFHMTNSISALKHRGNRPIVEVRIATHHRIGKIRQRTQVRTIHALNHLDHKERILAHQVIVLQVHHHIFRGPVTRQLPQAFYRIRHVW